ncbi:hypothetical protein [Campylobacter mucosalis]|uniref:hypothetical protein n=1 Tax=Campylobacter mucosalis TaxID=202 RepID=UPI0014701705|nr:hypothetical protein [Campylobacter mucosalis]
MRLAFVFLLCLLFGTNSNADVKSYYYTSKNFKKESNVCIDLSNSQVYTTYNKQLEDPHKISPPIPTNSADGCYYLGAKYINFNFLGSRNTNSKSLTAPLPILAQEELTSKEQDSYSVIYKGYIRIQKSGFYSFALEYKNAFTTIDLPTIHILPIEHIAPLASMNKAIPTKLATDSDFKNLSSFYVVNANIKEPGYYKFTIHFTGFKNGSKLSLKWLYNGDPAQTDGYVDNSSDTPQEIAEYKVIPFENLSQNAVATSEIKPRVVESDFVQLANVKKQHSFDWAYNSPIRTKISGKSAEFYLMFAQKLDNQIIPANSVSKDIYLVTHQDSKPSYNLVANSNTNFSGSMLSFIVPASMMSSTKLAYFAVLNPNGEYEAISDTFAIRPQNFQLNFKDTSVKSPLKSAKDYTINISAISNKKIDESYSYDIQDSSYIKNGKTTQTNLLIPNISKDHDCVAYDIPLSQNKILSFKNGKTDDIIINFKDALEFNVSVADKSFTLVDYEKISGFKSYTSDQRQEILDSIQNYGYECLGEGDEFLLSRTQEYSNIDEEAATFLKSGLVGCVIDELEPKNIEFLPAYVSVDYKLSGANGEQFSYINNTKPNQKMLGLLELELNFKNAKDENIQNFKNACYKKELNFGISYNTNAKQNANDSDFKEYKDLSLKYKKAENIVFDSTDTKFVEQEKNRAKYKISKDDLQNSQTMQIGFNFEKDVSQYINPFFIFSRDFLADEILLDQTQIEAKNNFGRPNNSIAMLYGRAYLPHYKGGFNSQIKATEYYGFYCDKECDLGNLDIKGEEMPGLNHWYVNKKHNQKNFGVVSDTDPFFTTTQISYKSEIKNGTRELTILNSDKAKQKLDDNIKLILKDSPWLIYNSNKDATYNNAPITFLRNIKNKIWSGEAHKASGEKESVEAKIFKQDQTDKSHKSKRIEW